MAEGLSFAFEVSQHAVAIAALIFLLTHLDIFSSVFEHGIHEAGQLVGGGGDSFGGAEVGLLSAQESAQGRMAVVQAQGGQAGAAAARLG